MTRSKGPKPVPFREEDHAKPFEAQAETEAKAAEAEAKAAKAEATEKKAA